MARLPLVPIDKLDHRLAEVLEAFKRAAPAFNPDAVRAMGNNPEVSTAFYNFCTGIRLHGLLDAKLKELVRLRIAELNDCRT
jgi:hypothetical protein